MVTLVKHSTRSVSVLAIRELIHNLIAGHNVPKSIRRFNCQFGIHENRVLINAATNKIALVCMDTDIVIQPQLCTSVGVIFIDTAVHIVKVMSKGICDGLTLQFRAVVAANVFQIRLALEIEVLSTEVHRVRCGFNVQARGNAPLSICTVDVKRLTIQHRILNGFDIINGDVGGELAERRTGMLSFDCVHDLLHHRTVICIDVVSGFDDICPVFVVFGSQTVTVVSVPVDIDGVDDGLIIGRFRIQVVLEAPLQYRDKDTVSGFCQFAGRECDSRCINGHVLIRNQRVIRITSAGIPVIYLVLRCLNRPVILTKIASRIALAVMLLHHQCTGFQHSCGNERRIDLQQAITGSVESCVVSIASCAVGVLDLGSLFVKTIACNDTEIISGPVVICRVQGKGDSSVFLSTLLVSETIRTPEIGRQPFVVMNHTCGLFPLCEGIDRMCFNVNLVYLTIIYGIQCISTAECDGCGKSLPIVIIGVFVLNIVAVALIIKALPVICFKYEGGFVLSHNTLIRCLRHGHGALFDLDDTGSFRSDYAGVDGGISLTLNLVVCTKLNSVSCICQHLQLYIHGTVRVIVYTIIAVVEYRRFDDACYGTVFGSELTVMTNLDPVAQSITGIAQVNHAVIPCYGFIADGLIVDDTGTFENLGGLAFPVTVVLNRCCFDCQQFQRNRFAVVPEMRRNLCNDRTVFGDLIASLVIYAGTKNRFAAYVNTGKVRNTILVYVVDYAAEVVAFLQQRSVVLVPDMNGISLVNLTIIEQLCVAQLAVDTSDTGGTNGRRAVTAVLKDSVPAFQSISTKVPVVAVSGTVCTQITGGVIEQSTVFGNFYIEVFAVPVTCEVLDGLPSRGIKAQLRQVEVFHQFVAIAQRIPVAAAVGESRQNLLGVCRIDTMDEVRHLLVGLVSGTDFTLLALRNPHQGVDAKTHFIVRCVVDLTTASNRKVTNLVHNKVAGTSQIEVVSAATPINGGLVQLAKSCICKVRCTTIILNPDIVECDLTITVRQSGRNRLSYTELIRPVGRRTMFDIGINHSLFIGVSAVCTDTKTTATVDCCLQKWAMRTTGRHNSGRYSQRVNNPAEIRFIACRVVAGTNEGIGIVFAHKSVHIPVTTADFPAVYIVIAGSCIVRVNFSFVINVVGVATAAAMCIEPGTGIGVHGIVTDTKAVAVTNIAFQGIISFARQVRFRKIASSPVHRIDSIITFCIL